MGAPGMGGLQGASAGGGAAPATGTSNTTSAISSITAFAKRHRSAFSKAFNFAVLAASVYLIIVAGFAAYFALDSLFSPPPFITNSFGLVVGTPSALCTAFVALAAPLVSFGMTGRSLKASFERTHGDDASIWKRLRPWFFLVLSVYASTLSLYHSAGFLPEELLFPDLWWLPVPF